MTRTYFVTGGAGFIGSNYVHRLVQRGEQVIIFDNLSRGGAPRNVAWLEESFGKDAFTLIVGDLRDADLVRESAKDADVIVHLAGQVAVTTSVINPRDDFEANALGTFNALEAARRVRLGLRAAGKLRELALQDLVEQVLELLDVAAGFSHDAGRLLVVQEGVEQVLDRHDVVPSPHGFAQSERTSDFDFSADLHESSPNPSGSAVHLSGCPCSLA